MNKIVNGVANDYEFPMYYESNIKTSRDETIGEDLSKQIIKMENVYVDFVRKKDKEIERLNNRIDKAIEYIEKTHYCEVNTYRDENGKLITKRLETPLINKEIILDILKGSDKE